MKKESLVSVLTPCFNGEQYIRKLLESVLSQTCKNVEMFVIDDGSTDGSADIIKSYITKFKKRNYKLEYVYQNNQGQSAAVNNGLKLISGKYLVWPDADDYYADNNTFLKMMTALESSDENTSMVRVQCNVMDKDGRIIGKLGVNSNTQHKTNLFEDCLFYYGKSFWGAAGSCMAKVSKIEELIPKRNIFTHKTAGQNWQLCLPLLYQHKCITIEEYLFNIVAHEDSHSRDRITGKERQAIYRKSIIKTLDNISMPADYRKYITQRVIKMTSVANVPTKKFGLRTIIKRLIKALVPYGLIVILRRKGILKTPQVVTKIVKASKSELEKISDYDNKIYGQGFARGEMNQTNIDSWMLFDAHVLEKAMSRVDFEAGHNIFRLEQLRVFLDEYDKRGFDKDSFAYKYALASVKEYILIHDRNGFPTNKIKTILDKQYSISMRSKDNLSGYKVIEDYQKADNQNINFLELQNNRYSVREFAKKKVNKSEIIKAVELSSKSPSVCNRQDTRVHIIMDKHKIEQVLEVQGGFAGYGTPPCLLLISSDTRYFVSPKERNQGFVDGGVFAMSILLSLEYYGLAACPLHAMFTPEVDLKVKDILDIREPEYLIMFIAVGHFRAQNKVAVSSRYPVRDIIREHIT